MDLRKIQAAYKTVSYHKKPDSLSLEEWQVALRRQWAENHKFDIENIGNHPVYSDFLVKGEKSDNKYKVAIRDGMYENNFCSCPDFKTNALGTCKHIEAVFLLIRKEPQLHVILQTEYKPRYTSVYIRYGAEREVKIRVGTENAEEFRALAQQWFDAAGVLLPASYYRFETFMQQALAISPSFRCYPDAMEFVLEMRERRKRQMLIDSKYRNGSGFDGLVSAQLFAYQREGVCFAAEVGRSLIADDMGLGKTIQAIAAAELLRKEVGIQKVYIVCPTSLKYQWQSEIKRFTRKQSIVIEGNPMKRAAQYASNESEYKIISYNTISNDWREVMNTEPDLIILDEAQRIKNYKSKVSNNVKQLHSQFAIVLSGTPLENKLEDLYSIMQFVNPYLLGPFYRYLAEHQIKNEFGKVTGYRNLHEINHLLAQCMVRRKRSEVLDQLPSRTDKTLLVPITEKQAEIHEEYKLVVARLVHKWRTMGFLNEKDRQRLMIALNTMRMVCNSTYIIDQATRFDTKITELMNILDELFGQGNEKVVIFSQWERMTRLIAEELRVRNVEFSYLHGGVASSDRGDLFTRFNTVETCRVFLSTDAGATGLNLQSASLLINLDIPWNPAVLEQRIARIHRMGQQNPVSIINMVASGTIEHRMLSILQFKSNLLHGVLDGGDDAIFMSDSAFAQLMNTVGDIVDSSGSTVDYQLTDADESADNSSVVAEDEPLSEEVAIAEDVPSVDESGVHSESEPILQQGLQFFASLNETLQNPQAAQKLMQQIIQTDSTDGKTYLRIPVENQETVLNALSALGALFGALNPKK